MERRKKKSTLRLMKAHIVHVNDNVGRQCKYKGTGVGVSAQYS